MRHSAKIFAFVSVVLMCLSCQDLHSLFWNDRLVARVGKTGLMREDVQAVIPHTLHGDDSVNFARSYIEKWIIQQLKLREAEQTLSAYETEIQKMVDDYRQSLLVKRLDQYIVGVQVSREPTEEEISEYYHSHLSDFLVSGTLIKGYVAVIPQSFYRMERLKRLLSSQKQEERADAEQMCAKGNFPLHRFSEWAPAAEMLSWLPIANSEDQMPLLMNRRQQVMRSAGRIYCFQVEAMLSEGESMPLGMVRGKIVDILRTRAQAEVIHQHEQQALEQALETGKARIIDEEKNE